MTLLAILLCVGAFVSLALSTDQHHHRVLGHKPGARVRSRLRAGGWAGIVLAFPAALAASGAIFGPVLWTGAVMLGAAAAFLVFNVALAIPVDPAKRR